MQIRVGSRGNVKVYSRWVFQFIVTQVIFLGSTLTDERERVGGYIVGGWMVIPAVAGMTQPVKLLQHTSGNIDSMLGVL
jgi:hypothetical protein